LIAEDPTSGLIDAPAPQGRQRGLASQAGPGHLPGRRDHPPARIADWRPTSLRAVAEQAPEAMLAALTAFLAPHRDGAGAAHAT